VSRGRRVRRIHAAGVTVALALGAGAGAGAAWAYWSAGGSGTGTASTATLPAGATPTATATSTTTVAVSFARAVTAGGSELTDYTVRRYVTAVGGAASAVFTCTWPSGSALTCSDTGVPGGLWYYTDAPGFAGSSWVGAESARSNGAATDTTPPTVSVTSITPPANEVGYHNSSPVTVGLTAADDAGGAGVASITYRVDSGAPTTVTAATAAVPVAGDGTHAVLYFATDNAGNASATSAQTVRIDTVAPGATTIASYPNPVNIANRTGVAVSGTAEPGATVTLTIADAGGAHTVSRTASADGAGLWSTTGTDVSTLADGTITYRASATDAAGNTGPAATATASKDTVAPTVAVSAGTNPVNSGNVAAATASGTVSGGTVALSVTDGTNTVTAPSSSNGGTWSAGPVDLSPLADGTITYTATATDAAGNTSTATRTATKDTAAPTVTGVAIGPTANSSSGSIRKGGSYYIYGNASDAASGSVAAVTANLNNVTPGAAAVALTATGGPFTAGGVTYAYRSAALTAGGALTAGAKTFTVTATDAASNSSTPANGSVNIDNTAPSASAVALANHTGGVAGKPEIGDTVTFTYSTEMDPGTLYSGWDWGSTPDLTNATVAFQDSPTGNGTNKNNDSLSVAAPAGIDLGAVTNLEGHLVPTAQSSYSFAATVHYAVTGGQSVVTVTLGDLNPGSTAVGTAASSTFAWTPPATQTDLATNPISGSVTRTAVPF
jgi:hypothetical protein